jgi:tRNA-intron endonuclease
MTQKSVLDTSLATLKRRVDWSGREDDSMETDPESRPAEEPVTSPIEAAIKDGRITVQDKARIGELEEAGYGSRDGKTYFLHDYEALYLLYSQKLRLVDEKQREMTFEQLADISQRAARDSWTKFIIYRDLRTRGYVVREGFGFGTDLRVYERGDYPKKAAQYVVFGLDEGIEKGIGDLQESVRAMAKMGKEAIIAVIERRGEVIYYKVGRARF